MPQEKKQEPVLVYTDGVAILTQMQGGAPQMPYVSIMLCREDKTQDFRTLVQKGLNTWDDAPRWLFDLADALEEFPIPRPRLREEDPQDELPFNILSEPKPVPHVIHNARIGSMGYRNEVTEALQDTGADMAAFSASFKVGGND